MCLQRELQGDDTFGVYGVGLRGSGKKSADTKVLRPNDDEDGGDDGDDLTNQLGDTVGQASDAKKKANEVGESLTSLKDSVLFRSTFQYPFV